LFVIGTLFLAREPLLLVIGNFLVIKNNLHSADVIHVIAGEDHRTDYAIKLFKQGYARQIFFTGGWCQPQNFSHGQHGRARALENGIPLKAISLDESEVTSTYSEVLKLKEFIGQSAHSINSVIVVSDPYHMRRCRWTYQLILGDEIEVEMAPVPFELSPYQRNWWSDKQSREFVKYEYLKIIYYYARYKLNWKPLRNWLTSLDKK
jgi:uncharacterized SAM-binding protein YcdF (DUF218 family)